MTKRVLYTKVPLPPPFFITLVQTQATESVTFSILLLIFVHGEYHSLKEKNANIDFFFYYYFTFKGTFAFQYTIISVSLQP